MLFPFLVSSEVRGGEVRENTYERKSQEKRTGAEQNTKIFKKAKIPMHD